MYIEDLNKTKYDIEMQNVNYKDIERRCRYYQSGLDRDSLRAGQGYEELSESYIIFLCNFDYVGDGLARYEKVSTYNGNFRKPYNDGSHVILLNTKFSVQNVSDSIASILKYADTNVPSDNDLVESIADEIKRIQSDKDMEVAYMDFQMYTRDVAKEQHIKDVILHAQGVMNEFHTTPERALKSMKDVSESEIPFFVEKIKEAASASVA